MNIIISIDPRCLSKTFKRRKYMILSKKVLSAVMSAVVLIGLLFVSTSSIAAEDISFHGYGELHYGNSNKAGDIGMMDQHRLVLGWKYEFNKNIELHAEIDFEHAAQEMELEFAFIDFKFKEALNFRAGSMIMPIGYLNEFHEPPLFYSVERPYVQKNVIPTTWQEGGAGIFGRFPNNLRYRVYLVNSLDASKFKASSGLRSGRHKVSEAPSDDLAVVGRVEYFGTKNLRLGFSGYQGNTGNGNKAIGDASVSIIETDVRYFINNLELTGLFTQILIGDTDKINALSGEAVGKNIHGSYVEAAYHAGRHFLPEDKNLVCFLRHELFNTQNEMAGGIAADPKNDLNVTTVGTAYFPISRVVLKLDVELWNDGADNSWEQTNLGIGYMF